MRQRRSGTILLEMMWVAWIKAIALLVGMILCLPLMITVAPELSLYFTDAANTLLRRLEELFNEFDRAIKAEEEEYPNGE